MDSITHAVLGACIGEAVAGKQMGRRAMVWGMAAQSFPDIDVVASFWMDTAGNLLAHRGFTHSILCMILVTPLFALTAARLHRSRGVPLSRWMLLIGLNIFIHLLLDSQNAYGTGLFEPFSHIRVAFNTLFVADPLFTIVAGIATVAMAMPRSKHKTRILWARAGIICSALYLGYCTVNKIIIDREVKHLLQKQHIAYDKKFVTPTPLNSMLWYVVATNDSGSYIGYRSIFDKRDDMPLYFYARNEAMLKEAEDHESTQKLIRFSQGYYTAEKWGDTLVFNDLRFGQMGGWEYPDGKFVFHYFLHDSADNAMVIQRGRLKWDARSFKGLITRIKGE